MTTIGQALGTGWTSAVRIVIRISILACGLRRPLIHGWIVGLEVLQPRTEVNREKAGLPAS